MATNPYVGISDNEKKLLKELAEEAQAFRRKMAKELGWTDQQIDDWFAQETKRKQRSKVRASGKTKTATGALRGPKNKK